MGRKHGAKEMRARTKQAGRRKKNRQKVAKIWKDHRPDRVATR
jgi:hypothetical protein